MNRDQKPDRALAMLTERQLAGHTPANDRVNAVGAHDQIGFETLASLEHDRSRALRADHLRSDTDFDAGFGGGRGQRIDQRLPLKHHDTAAGRGIGLVFGDLLA